ncbi:MAG: T9SS type A sorting domain-containing protein [Bacteroidetes bacterium]|nr:T9SS type A sorting domain-containing protein [Bacteroidota bacterium]
MRKAKFCLLIGILVWNIGLSGQTLNRPESIIYDGAHNRYLISNYGNGQNGSILAYDPFEDVYSNFNTAHSVGPKGLAIYNNVLYVSESGFINGFDLDSKQRVFNKEVGTFWINDLTVDEDGNLYTGESNTGVIYKVSTTTGQVEQWATGGLEDVNGLLVDQPNNRLLAVFYKHHSPIMAFDLETAEASTLAETIYSSFDGITVDNCGKYYISSQASQKVFGFDQDFLNPPTIVVEDLLKPADIFFNKEMEVLCIPEIDDNQIVFVDVFKTCQSPMLLFPEDSQTVVSLDEVLFSWEPILNVDYYRFELATDPEFNGMLVVDGTGVPEFLIEFLSPSTNYFWRVRAYKNNQPTDYSNVWSFTTGSTSRINNNESKNEFKIFPNPARESINLSWGDEVPVLLQVYNSTGQKVFEFSQFNQSIYSNQRIQLDDLKPGIYHCSVKMQNCKPRTRRMIID